MGTGVKNAPLYQFSLVTSTNLGFTPKNILNFSFNSFVTLVYNFKFVPSTRPKFLILITP